MGDPLKRMMELIVPATHGCSGEREARAKMMMATEEDLILTKGY